MITKDDLRKIAKEVFYSSERTITFYTGIEGSWLFSWTLFYGDTLKCRYFRNTFEKLKSFQYFSLFEKSGKYKLKVIKDKFEFFKGTKLIHTIDGVVNEWNSDSGDMYHINTKNKLKEVNDYIKILEK